MNCVKLFRASLIKRFILATLFLYICSFTSYASLEGQRNKIKLTDNDRAVIIQSVLQEVFNPQTNYRGKYYILAEGIRQEWVPRISGYTLTLVTKEELNSFGEHPHYYVIKLKPLAKSVAVNVNLYHHDDGRRPEVNLNYNYRRINGTWKGKYLGGGGN